MIGGNAATLGGQDRRLPLLAGHPGHRLFNRAGPRQGTGSTLNVRSTGSNSSSAGSSRSGRNMPKFTGLSSTGAATVVGWTELTRIERASFLIGAKAT